MAVENDLKNTLFYENKFKNLQQRYMKLRLSGISRFFLERIDFI